ncbi:MAG TPA: transcription antitermination factor NusB [Egibacteraceae bacterium]|nr:transcription antitermination factor NusB [Egibacteraceae bacterium]
MASRAAAYRTLRRVHAGGAWSPRALGAALRRGDLPARDRAFAANLAYETLRWEGTLDWALGRVLTRPLGAVDPEVLDVLRLGACQLLFTRTPDRAAVASTVDLARAQLGPGVTGFVNGVLRALARARAELPWPPVDDDRGLSLATGYPEWVVVEARARFGARARAVLEAGNRPPGLTLRARGDAVALAGELRAAGLAAAPGRHAPEAVRAPGADPADLACVAEGRATPQDEASMLVSRAVAARVADGDVDGWLALDACAGPGGKATHLAQLGARVVAVDVRPSRARLVTETARRLGVAASVRVAVTDSTAPALRASVFDAALVDAPCTGLGVVRRRPELRWRHGPADPTRLAALQLALLEGVADAVRPGGWLVYSVCTWTRAETVDVAAAFLAAHGDRFESDPDAGPPSASDRPGQVLPGDPGLQLAPDTDDVDGMYVLCLRRGTPEGHGRAADRSGL